MGLNILSVSSDGLVHCLDPFEERLTPGGESLARKAIKNILHAQRFDSIPLRMSDGTTNRIARRRLHQGDVEDDVFILSLEECATVSTEISLLEAMFQILSNEHHILFILDELGQPSSVLTLNMLASPIVHEYLILKTTKLAEDGWHWNKGFLHNQFPPPQLYAKQIYDAICSLSQMVDDTKPLPSDLELSTQIVELLLLLQPLKSIPSPHYEDRFSVDVVKPPPSSDDAQALMMSPVACLLESQTNVLEEAFRLFASANDWDYLVVLEQDHAPKNLVRLGPNGHLIPQNIHYVEPNMSRSACLNELEMKSFAPLFTRTMESEELGILTVENVLLDHEFIPQLLARIAHVEEATRVHLFEKGDLYVKSKIGNVLCMKADWVDIINRTNEKHQESLHHLREWRNLLVHAYLPLVGSDELPVWMRYGFSEGLKHLEKREKAFNNAVNPAYRGAFGLNEYLRQTPNSSRGGTPKDLFKQNSGLISASAGEGTLELEFQPDLLENWKNRIEKMDEHDRSDWTGFQSITLR